MEPNAAQRILEAMAKQAPKTKVPDKTKQPFPIMRPSDLKSLNPEQARLPDFEGFVYRATGNHICAGDQDYFKVFLFGNETVYGNLTFEQTTPNEDLDFLVYDESGALLTQCTAEDTSGCTDNGQSGTSNETFSFTAPDAQFYYVVVNGFDGAENDYDVCLAVQDGLCP